ncbi:protein shisa-5 isoform X1 [Labeo rohita]|uniref:protein shisa-5 isoform X1 n=2 Tax=Labeo rohita TaxID=84645 RepID=UPI0021E2EFD3|nr:protein shisa-5 isoform X1 [Labeo rohita]XP_050969974.1 protein shisa-5 isoform X1 [Labeo rohita]
MLSYVNFAIASLSFRYQFVLVKIFPDMYLYAHITCDILIFIVSLAIAVTSCSCCWSPKPTPVMVSYVATDLPVNHIVQLGQPDPSAVAGHVSSVMYVLPAAHGSNPPAPLPNYGPVPNASPPIYSPVPTTPPPNYDKVSDALPLNYGPVPNAPPSAYEHEDLQTRK